MRCLSGWVRPLCALLLVACGSGPPEARASGKEQPPTVWDPPAFTPPPTAEGETGEAVGLSSSGGYDQARSLALEFLRAVRDGDARSLETLLAEQVMTAHPPSSARRPRSTVIQQAVGRRAGLDPDMALDELVHIDQLEVTPLSHGNRPIPDEMMGSDLFVRVPLKPHGRRWFRLSGWNREGALVVRPGPTPVIIAL